MRMKKIPADPTNHKKKLEHLTQGYVISNTGGKYLTEKNKSIITDPKICSNVENLGL